MGFQGFSERLIAHLPPADLIKQTLRAYSHTPDGSEKTSPARNQKPQAVQRPRLDSRDLGFTLKQHNYSILRLRLRFLWKVSAPHKINIWMSILLITNLNTLNQNESNSLLNYDIQNLFSNIILKLLTLPD